MTRRAEVLFYVCACAFSLFLVYETLNFPKTLAYRGAGDWPLLILLSLTGVSAALLLKSLWTGSTIRPREVSTSQPIRLFVAIGALVVYTLLLTTTGFVALTPFFLAGMMWLLGERRPILFILIPLLSTLGAFIFFQRIMQLMLPRGYGVFRVITEMLS